MHDERIKHGNRENSVLKCSGGVCPGKEKIVDAGIRQGVLPKPDGYLADGTPVYSSRLIEDFFGVSRDEISRRIQILNEARQSVGKEPLSFPDDTLVHKVQ